MVTFTHPSGNLNGPVPFSFDDDRLDRAQPVRVVLGGFEYPGEVIVAGQWRAEFGRPLSGVSMFRLVLLHSSDAPAPDDITDDRICVAVPRGGGGCPTPPVAGGSTNSRPGEGAASAVSATSRATASGAAPSRRGVVGWESKSEDTKFPFLSGVLNLLRRSSAACNPAGLPGSSTSLRLFSTVGCSPIAIRRASSGSTPWRINSCIRRRKMTLFS